jgi:hypothetical protein
MSGIPHPTTAALPLEPLNLLFLNSPIALAPLNLLNALLSSETLKPVTQSR